MILVTGGLGFIGTNFIEMHQRSLLGLEDEILILDKLTYAANKDKIESFLQNASLKIQIDDIANSDVVRNLVYQCSGIIHFAAETHVDRSISSPKNFIDTNILGTWNLIHWANYYNKRLLIVSTDEVYGSIDAGTFSEEDRLKPSSPYSASKAAADLLSLSYYHTFGTDIVITRCTNNYGKYQNIEKLIPTIIRKLSAGDKIPIYGDGRNIRNWISAEDHCEGIALAFKYGKAGEIYNFGTDEYISNLDLCKLFVKFMEKDESRIEFVEDRKGHDFRYAVDFQKSQRELNWTPRITISEKLGEMVEWYTKHSKNC